jgi:hypothetical protein
MTGKSYGGETLPSKLRCRTDPAEPAGHAQDGGGRRRGYGERGSSGRSTAGEEAQDGAHEGGECRSGVVPPEGSGPAAAKQQTALLMWRPLMALSHKPRHVDGLRAGGERRRGKGRERGRGGGKGGPWGHRCRGWGASQTAATPQHERIRRRRKGRCQRARPGRHSWAGREDG